MAEASQNLRIEYSVLRRWKKQLIDDPYQAFAGKGRLKASDEKLRQLGAAKRHQPKDGTPAVLRRDRRGGGLLLDGHFNV